jgi:hypothetical protein
MTVSAAIRRVKKLKGLIAERDGRLKESAVFLESKTPAFPFGDAFGEREKLVSEMISIQTAIAKSNAVTMILSQAQAHWSVAYVVRRLDEMKATIKMLKDLPFRAKTREEVIEESRDWDETMSKQITVRKTLVWISAMSQVERAKRVESMTDTFELLNNDLEVSNHSTFIEIEGA